MFRVYGCIAGQHDIRLVVVAAVICLFACYTAFSLLARADSTARQGRLAWLGAAAAVTGSGIWSTHFVAMLAFRPGLPMGYDPGLTALSVAIAILVSGAGLLVATQRGVSAAALGGAIVGAGIAAMHFTGMAALSVPAVKHWDAGYVRASLIIGIAFAALALTIGRSRPDFRGRLASAGCLALAICGLHFTAMAAFSLEPDPRVILSSAVMAPEWLAVAVAALSIMIVALFLAGAVVDEHLARRAVAEAGRLREHIAALESTQRQLQATTDQLRRALGAAAAASQAKSQFLAMMSHELRTPLNAIIGFSEIAVGELFGPIEPRYREYSRNVIDSGKHLLGLINDILDFSKIESGHFDLREEAVDAAGTIADTVHMLHRQAEEAGIRLMVEVPANLPPLRADPQRLRQILLNLLANALKFTPRGGQVQVTAMAQETGLVIAIRDTGIGMADEDIPNALERFVQIDSDLNRKHGGTGLGLPLSKRLVELHDGMLEIESAVGIGTTVRITFPRQRLLDAA